MKGYMQNNQFVFSRGNLIRHPDTGGLVSLPVGECPRAFFGVTLMDVARANPSPQDNTKMPGGSTFSIREDCIVETLSWVDKPRPSADDVRAEAHRRICDYCPEWKQRNLTARAAELALKRSGGEALTASELAEYQSGQAVWDHIKAIRGASNALEATAPHDFRDDQYWPQVPS